MLKTYKVTLKESGCVVKIHGGIKANDAISAIDQVSVFATSNQEWVAKELKPTSRYAPLVKLNNAPKPLPSP